MRTIQISTEVFAAIWAARRPGEEGEDAILRRLLNAGEPDTRSASAPSTGWVNNRYRVAVPEGFSIDRNFKGTQYEARATGGAWILQNNGTRHRTLTSLSEAIGTGIENVWVNWFYVDKSGTRHPMADLRDPASITRRGR
jgi:hypothetical protein